MRICNVKVKVVQLHMLKYKVPLEKTTEDSRSLRLDVGRLYDLKPSSQYERWYSHDDRL